MTGGGTQLTVEIEGHTWPLKPGDVIGRFGTVGGDVLAGHDALSRRHLQITQDGGRWCITLMPGVRNITTLDGKPLVAGAAMPLERVSDVVVDTLRFRFRVRRHEVVSAGPDDYPVALVSLDELLRVRSSNEFARILPGAPLEPGADFGAGFDIDSSIRLRHALMSLGDHEATDEMELGAASAPRWFGARFRRHGASFQGVIREITAEREHRQSVQAVESRLIARADALNALLSSESFRDGDLPAALPLLMEHASALLPDATASVWVDARDGWRCIAASAAGRQLVGKSACLDPVPARDGALDEGTVENLKRAGIASAAATGLFGCQFAVPDQRFGSRALLAFERTGAAGWPPPQRRFADLIATLLQQVFANAHRSDTLRRLQVHETALAAELADAAGYIRKQLPAPIETGAVRTEWVYRPCGKMGGDIFGYEWLDGAGFALFVIDVMGHGGMASLHALSLAQTLRLLLARDGAMRSDPSRWLAALNTAFPMHKHHDLLWTMWSGLFEPGTRVLKFSSGGHPPALLLHKGGCQELSTPGPVLGALPEARYSTATVHVPEGARLFLYTDGVYEFPLASVDIGALADFTLAVSGVAGMERGECAFLEARAAALCAGTEFPDDFTIVCARFTG